MAILPRYWQRPLTQVLAPAQQSWFPLQNPPTPTHEQRPALQGPPKQSGVVAEHGVPVVAAQMRVPVLTTQSEQHPLL